jgi:hypothetical protein
MGIRGRLSGADKLATVRDRVLRDIDAQLSSGRDEAGVVISQSDIGVRFRLDTFANWIREEIDTAGYRVIAMTDPGWSHQMTVKSFGVRFGF